MANSNAEVKKAVSAKLNPKELSSDKAANPTIAMGSVNQTFQPERSPKKSCTTGTRITPKLVRNAPTPMCSA